jgi:hypothetical protein
MKIISANIGPYPATIFEPSPMVSVTFENGTKKDLFFFYPDELSFTESEFIGLTEEEARALFHQKDVAYLRS